ncbi:MAG: hypothetical protein WBA29_11630, partial [Xanthobacteraceae bacterium]
AEVVASDQLNEVDRAATAATDTAALAPTLALATIDPAASVTTGQAAFAATGDASSWAQASFIGKIFIAFGGLLTLASAARMLFA